MTDYGSHLEDPSLQTETTYDPQFKSETPSQQQQIIDPNSPQNSQQSSLLSEEQDNNDIDIDDTFADLFGSDHEIDDTNNTTDNKIVIKEYKRSVPEGKKESISTNTPITALPQSSDFEFCILRLPNVIGCETEEFTSDTYVEPSSTSNIENYIRWRTHYDTAMEETFKESNTKLVYWKDGTKSLFIGKTCYDINEQILSGNRDFIYAKLNVGIEKRSTDYKVCHGQFIKRLNVKATSQKSRQIFQKNLAKKHERTKGSKQLTALQRKNNRNSNGRGNGAHSYRKGKRVNRKRSLRDSFLEQGAHGSDSEEEIRERKRRRGSDVSEEESEGSDEDEYSESESDEDDEDDQPIGERL